MFRIPVNGNEMTEVLFNAYSKQAGGKTWDGKDIPPFSEVGQKVQDNWRAVTTAAVKYIEELIKTSTQQ